MVKASALFYSKQDKFIPNNATIGKGMAFITTALGSTNDKNGHNCLTYIWRVVRGVFPSVVHMSENGAVIYFNAPKEKAQIEIELKVTDNETKNSDTASIVIDVVDVEV